MRLTEEAYCLGLIDDEQWSAFCRKQDNIAKTKEMLKDTWVTPVQLDPASMREVLGTSIEREYSLKSLLCRPSVKIDQLATLKKVDGALVCGLEGLNSAEREQVEIDTKYEGYILRRVTKSKKRSRMKLFKFQQNLTINRFQDSVLKSVKNSMM